MTNRIIPATLYYCTWLNCQAATSRCFPRTILLQNDWSDLWHHIWELLLFGQAKIILSGCLTDASPEDLSNCSKKLVFHQRAGSILSHLVSIYMELTMTCWTACFDPFPFCDVLVSMDTGHCNAFIIKVCFKISESVRIPCHSFSLQSQWSLNVTVRFQTIWDSTQCIKVQRNSLFTPWFYSRACVLQFRKEMLIVFLHQNKSIREIKVWSQLCLILPRVMSERQD